MMKITPQKTIRMNYIIYVCTYVLLQVRIEAIIIASKMISNSCVHLEDYTNHVLARLKIYICTINLE